jgi:hypothetical protein
VVLGAIHLVRMLLQQEHEVTAENIMSALEGCVLHEVLKKGWV